MDEGDDEIGDRSQIGCTPSIQMPRSKLRLDMQQYVIAGGQAGRLKQPSTTMGSLHWY